jgi:hypothetical protein
MKTFKINQTIAALWLAFALTFGSGLVATKLGADMIPSAHACGLGAGSGGGC